MPTGILASPRHLSLLVVEDVAVTSVQDGHGGAAEELAAGGAELNLSRGGVSMGAGTLQSLQRDFFSGLAGERKRLSGREQRAEAFRAQGGRLTLVPL